ncbi:MAG: UDP-glucose dehydrogenase family protein [archaeon]
MKISVIGNGYVGTTLGIGLSYIGHDVIGIDKDKEKVNMLKSKKLPIYEKGLEEILKQNANKNLNFTTDFSKIKETEIIFLAVGTPMDEKTGKANLTYIMNALEDIAPYINKEDVIITKSTVPIGTNKKIKNKLKQLTDEKFYVASNPEFLREGRAWHDFLNQDRIIIGIDSKEPKERIDEMYSYFKDKTTIMYTDINSAEMIKYASNSFLATSISFINEMSRIAEKFNANIDQVSHGMKLDKRIGKHAFLKAGIGYGGSCFPKDVNALYNQAKNNKIETNLLKSTLNVNQTQTDFFVKKIENHFKNKDKVKLGILGLAFKEGTDDIRYSKSIEIIKKLSDKFNISAYDPKAVENTKKVLKNINYTTKEKIIDECEAIVLATPWDEFKNINLEKIGVLFDGKNFFKRNEIEKYNIKYYAVGK